MHTLYVSIYRRKVWRFCSWQRQPTTESRCLPMESQGFLVIVTSSMAMVEWSFLLPCQASHTSCTVGGPVGTGTDADNHVSM